MIVLRTLGAQERRRRVPGRRRARPVETQEEPEPVPTVRATLIHAEPLDDPDIWLERMRRDGEAREAEVDAALAELNAVLRSHRAAAADPYTREVTRRQANAVRVGHGSGEQVADGRFTEACEAPEPRSRERRADTLAPQERLAAMLAGSDRPLVAEELVLRARLDLGAGCPREAALQARVALEALLAEAPETADAVTPHRDAVARAANAALEGDPPEELVSGVADAVTAMRRAVAHRARSRNP